MALNPILRAGFEPLVECTYFAYLYRKWYRTNSFWTLMLELQAVALIPIFRAGFELKEKSTYFALLWGKYTWMALIIGILKYHIGFST